MYADDTPVRRKAGGPIAGLALALALSACGPAPIDDGIYDPHEARNREVHRGNVALDATLVRPIADAFGTAAPGPLRRGITHFAGNIDTPRMVVNSLLQGRVEDAVHSSFRFLVNSTIGLGGLFDPATDIGLEERDTDFGATLYIWGVGEGAYVELPVLGPSTDRDTFGKVVDTVLNPLGYVLEGPARNAVKVAGPLKTLDERFTYGDTVDSVLHESADSYAQARTLYLQHRRFELRKLTGEQDDAYIDPYGDDAGGDAGAGLGYVDPYAELQQ